MNSKLVFLTIAIVAAFGTVAAVGLVTVTPVSAVQHLGNATAGNMTGNLTAGNMTAGNLTG
jgi:anthranilate/para-aminobenzoate synthase component I